MGFRLQQGLRALIAIGLRFSKQVVLSPVRHTVCDACAGE